MRVLTVNVGSSNVKLRVLEDDDEVWGRTLDAGDDAFAADSIRGFLTGAPDFDAVGHRLVHGGPDFRSPVVVDDEVVSALRGLGGLAPLHNGAAISLLEATRSAIADLPHVACFDSAFHRTLPDAAAVYPVPWAWTQSGMRRYGFHGLSFAYATRRATETLAVPASDLRLVICHLGSGASLAAVRDGRSVDTTMGVTPNEGLMMGSRSGSIDPSGLLWMMGQLELSPQQADRELQRESGLLGVSGVSSDLRHVLEAAEGGHKRAALAVEIYLHRLRSAIAAMAASLGGLDCLVFTGGVGEHSPIIRARACEGLGFLGVDLDQQRNDSVAGDAVISADRGATTALVVEAREDIEIASETRTTLASVQATLVR